TLISNKSNLCARASPASFSFLRSNAKAQGHKGEGDAKLREMCPRFSTYVSELPLATTEASEL
ncbi:MAG: hypothetical protein KAR25_01980, partial [Methanosarcinales archaeon]|nr:hypothetical protein [Methanosarcinales archaeon]